MGASGNSLELLVKILREDFDRLRDVFAGFAARAEIGQDAVVLDERMDFIFGNAHILVLQVGLRGDQDEREVGLLRSQQFRPFTEVHKALDAVEGEEEEAGVCPADVRFQDETKLVLPTKIPNCEIENEIAERDYLIEKIHADRQAGICQEDIGAIPVQERGLTYSTIPANYDLVYYRLQSPFTTPIVVSLLLYRKPSSFRPCERLNGIRAAKSLATLDRAHEGLFA